MEKENKEVVIFRPVTRGELANRLKAGETCEIPDYGIEMTKLMLKWWLGVDKFTVEASKNDGFVLFIPTKI